MPRKQNRVAELAAYKNSALKTFDAEAEKDRYLRLAAEFDNFKKRSAKRYAEIMERANDDLLLELLDVMDDFERALSTVSDEKKASKESKQQGILEGMKLIYDKLGRIMAGRGIEPMEALHKQFDPAFHDAVMRSPSDHKEGTVIEVIQKGYLLRNRVLRHARVVVASPENER